MIKSNFILLAYTMDVVCILDKGKEPICKKIRRSSGAHNENTLPQHDLYIPRNNTFLFNCSIECKLVTSKSMTELTSPKLDLKSCYKNATGAYECESIRYNHLKNVDKVLFLSRTIPEKTFYLVDCLVYSGGERVCHKKGTDNSHANLIDTGAIARPKEPTILAQDEFICEETKGREVNCDLNPLVPFKDGLKLKEAVEFGDNVLLKTGSYVIILNRVCIGSWCGYSGRAATRRQYGYWPPGGKVYRCYYANKQQICKELYSQVDRPVYNDRGWLSS